MMPRILHLRTVSGPGGGPEKTLLAGPRYLRDRYEMRLAFIRPRVDPRYDLPRRARAADVSMLDIPECCAADPRTLRSLAREIREFRPDILHAHDYKTDLLGVVLAKWFGVKLMTTLHGYVTRGGRLELYYFIDRLALRWMDHLIVVSDDLSEHLENLGIASDRVTRIENGVDTTDFRRRVDRAEAKRTLGLHPERFLIGAVGRLSEEKGFDRLINAVARRVEEGSDLELVLVGEGNQRSDLQRRVQQHGLGDRIHLLGHRSDPVAVYEAMDVFVLCSLREGLPNVLLEAMAMELPVVATRVGGVAGVIRDGENGLLIEPDDTDRLLESLRCVQESGELRERLSRAARESVQERFSFGRRMEKIGDLYDRLLDRDGHPATLAPPPLGPRRGRHGNRAMNAVVHTHAGKDIRAGLTRWEKYLARSGNTATASSPRWLRVFQRGLGHVPYCVEAVADDRTRGLLPLAYIQSMLFGRFLVSLPYVNTAGVVAEDQTIAAMLIDAAVELADRLDVAYLELRHEAALEHPSLEEPTTQKVHMRRELPDTAESLWDDLSSKVRNQVRNAQSRSLSVHWGGVALLGEFYRVFSRNMRDLGTPVYGKQLFRSILEEFPEEGELCVVRDGRRTLAAALLLHGPGTTEVPSASSLRRYNHTNANMLLYWSLLERACQRGQRVFDFGRCTTGSGVHRFKRQWGSAPVPAVWQYYTRRGSPADMRPKSPKYRLLTRVWQRLPITVTRLLGPSIVRGIP